jgi:hypothetical protein
MRSLKIKNESEIITSKQSLIVLFVPIISGSFEAELS